ncbi:MAG TPA: hypothetical protein VN700_18795 [Vicinamibacterales bacterium]|nr:hypothetical protein [Vicinamibacterales bacterium]
MKLSWQFGGMVLATAVSVAPALGQEKLVHQEIDRNTHAIVRVFKTTTGGRIEVETPRLKLTKTVAGESVVTRVSEAGDELTISMNQRTLTVASKASRVSTSRTDKVRGEQARAIVAASSAGRSAAELIGRMGLGAATPVQPMLITTRLFLNAAAGVRTGGGELARWAREARAVSNTRATAFKVSLAAPDQDSASKGRTPTECWNDYAKEAIAAYMEYEDCMKEHQSWWDVLGRGECGVVYDMRAIGAFTWWLKCVAINN